jgi:hypothetical protein
MLVGNPAFEGILDTGYWMLDAGCKILITGYRLPITGFWLERSVNPAFAEILDTGRSSFFIQHPVSSIQYLF